MRDNVRRELEWGENVREVSRMPQQQDHQPCNDETEATMTTGLDGEGGDVKRREFDRRGTTGLEWEENAISRELEWGKNVR